MSESKATGPVVVHAFFGALTSVVAGVVLNPFFGELLHLAPMLGVLALAFVFLNIGLTPLGSTPLTVEAGVGNMTILIRIPIIVFVIAVVLLILGLALPWQINLANKEIPKWEQIEASTRYVFLILGAIYIISVAGYNLVVKVARGESNQGRGR